MAQDPQIPLAVSHERVTSLPARRAKLSRKEFADVVRATYPDASVLDDDEVIEIAISHDLSVQDYLETPEETLFNESGASAPPPLPSPQSPATPYHTVNDSSIEAEQETDLSLFPSAVQPLLRSVTEKLRPFSQGVKEGITAGGMKADVKSTSSGIPRLAGNIVGGGAATALAAFGGPPALATLGAAQGTAMATRTNLDQLDAERKAAAAAGEAPYIEPTLLSTMTPKGVTRIGGQAAVQAAGNAIPFRFAGSVIPNILKGAGLGVLAGTAPVAVDQLVDQRKLDVMDPQFKDAYRLAAGIGLGAGTVSAVAGQVSKARPVETIPPPEGEPKIHYDIPPRQGEQGPGTKGAEWYGDPGHRDAEGWTTVGSAMSINGQRVRQVRVVPTPGNRPGVEVRFDDGMTAAFVDPFKMRNDLTGQMFDIDPQRKVRRSGGPQSPGAEGGPSSPAPPVDMGPAALPPPQAALPPAPITLPKATFAGYKDNGLGSMVPLFAVEGDPTPRSLQTLQERGVAVPDFPTVEAWQNPAKDVVGLSDDPEGRWGGLDMPPMGEPGTPENMRWMAWGHGNQWKMIQRELDEVRLNDPESPIIPDLEHQINYFKQKEQDTLKAWEAATSLPKKETVLLGDSLLSPAKDPSAPMPGEQGFTKERQRQLMREYTNISPEERPLSEGARTEDNLKREGIEISDLTSERGSATTDALLHTGAAAAGGLLGGLQGDGDDNFNWPMALIGAGIGLGASTTLRTYFKKIGKEQELIKGLSTHPSLNKMLTRTSPGALHDTDLKSAIRTAYEDVLDDTFTPHALLKREGGNWSRINLGVENPEYFQPAVNALDKLTMDKFTIPPKVAESFKSMITDVLKDDNSYERLLRITRLRADVEQRQNDLGRRNEGFTWLAEYRKAKAAGDWDKTRMYRQKLRANPGILKPLPDVMRGNVPPEHATRTLARLEKEAFDHHPDVLVAAENWKKWGAGMLDQLEGIGVDVNELRRLNRNYFPNFVLEKMGKSGKISVGGPQGIGRSRSGYLKRRERQDPDQKIWMDLAGPFFKRMIDQEVDVAKRTAAMELLRTYDPYKNGTLPPDTPSVKPEGDYTYWEYKIPGETGEGHGRIGGWLPVPVAAEVQRHYLPAKAWQRVMDTINSPLKGFLIRASGGGFILNNNFGNVSDMYFSTPMREWPSLTLDGTKAIAATILEATAGPMRRAGIDFTDPVRAKVDALIGLSEAGRKAGIGTEAAAAEITSQALNDPRIADKAIDPLTPDRVKAARAIERPVRAYGRGFDNVRQASENITRLAHFIHLTQSNGVEPKQAGRIVNMVQGNYNPTNETIREKDIKRFAIFWSFYKNALPNWLPLLGREIAYGDQIHGGRGASRLKTLAPLGKKLAAVSAIGLAANLWNHLFFPDAEASLSDYQKEQFHILMPDMFNKNGVWDEEKKEWRLAYHGWPTPGNVARRAVGMAGVQNRVLHAAQGTGSGDEIERSWEQIKDFWSGLAHPVFGTAAAIMTGKDPISGQPVVEPGSNNWQAAVQWLTYPAKGLPGLRPMYSAAREAAEPGEGPAHFVRRMLVGSLYQPLNRDNQEVRRLARAVAGGNRAAVEKSRTAREEALFNGEQEQWTPEEVASILTGNDKVSWQGKAMKLANLPKFIEKMGEISPADPGAVEAITKAGKATTADLRKSGPVFLPTRDYLRALGPDEVLKQFLLTFQGDQRQGDAWRSGATQIVQQLRNESKNWEIPASLMMMLQQSPSAEANTEILSRISALEKEFDPTIQVGDKIGRKIFGQ